LDQILKKLEASKKLIEVALKKKQELNGETEQSYEKVGLYRAGAIRKECWGEAFQKKYNNHAEWDMKMVKEISTWEDLIMSQDYNPLKVVKVGPDRWEVTSPDLLYLHWSIMFDDFHDQFKSLSTSCRSEVDLQLASKLTLPSAHVL
jgi:hypothetical protein